MSVDEMIIASINCLDGIEEHFKTQMIAWVRSAADFGEINDKLVKENAELKKELQDYQFNYDSIKELTEENADLKAQIEKMKCCGNCKNKKSKPTCFFCVKLSKWELTE